MDLPELNGRAHQQLVASPDDEPNQHHHNSVPSVPNDEAAVVGHHHHHPAPLLEQVTSDLPPAAGALPPAAPPAAAPDDEEERPEAEAMQYQQPVKLDGGDSEDEEEGEDEDGEEEDDDDDDVAAAPAMPEGAYDPGEWDGLPVPPDVKELFGHIVRYTPQATDLDFKFRPFIPDYIPAVGDIDAFIKVGRPDKRPEVLGLTVLDEPSAGQSDPSVLELQLIAVTKQTAARSVKAKRVGPGEQGAKAVEKWVKDISDLHRSKPPPTVHYGRQMPDIDALMQEWPADVEEMLKEVGIPTASFSADLTTYADIVCSLLDIPVYKSRVQALHVLFSLYSAFKSSHHFGQLAQENKMDNALKYDRLELE